MGRKITTTDFITRARDAHSNITEIPYWEHAYVHPYSSKLITPNGVEDVVKIYPEFPNMEVENFYNLFKNEFFNGNYIDLNGLTNYSFYLLFDIIGLGYDMCEKYLPILLRKYPETSDYCETEMGKLKICSREYNGEQYYKYYPGPGHTDCFVVKNDFVNKDKILYWLTQSDEFRPTGVTAYVNSEGIINVISDDTKKIFGKEKKGCRVLPIENRLPFYIKFGLVEGNFRFLNCGWNTTLSAESNYTQGPIYCHDIITLQGSPDIVKGNFIAQKLGLTSLENSPHTVYGDFIVSHNKLMTLKGMPKYVEGTFNIYDNEIDDNAYEWADKNYPDHSVGNINIGRNKLVKYRK